MASVVLVFVQMFSAVGIEAEVAEKAASLSELAVGLIAVDMELVAALVAELVVKHVAERLVELVAVREVEPVVDSVVELIVERVVEQVVVPVALGGFVGLVVMFVVAVG